MNKIRLLPCELTDAEIQGKGEELAAAELEHQNLLSAKKKANDDFKAPIGQQVGLIAKLTREITEKSEEREVEVTERPDFSIGVVDVVRLDTGEVVDSRPLTDDERQIRMDVGFRETN